MLWFTADTHFGDERIIHHAHRPFNNTAQMATALIDGINERVAPDDILYFLGDFSYHLAPESAHKLRERIACRRIRLVAGNHDEDWAASRYADDFETIRDYEEVAPGFARGTKLVLFHYPIMSWNGKRREAIQLHGHIHSEGSTYNERDRDRGILRYDVGVDANGYCPVSLTEVLEFFKDTRAH